ncbi:MAG: ROK family transcriptional regulator [Candidatus Glassbacteria bacterium]|nr:ROK family transcriptional regulator [Candidatus Glassbacteria bacterium]
MKINLEKIVAADHKVIRQINRLNVLNTVRDRRAISRVEISRLTGLNKSTISNIVGELIKEGLVYEESLGKSSVGRKPIILKVNEKSRIFGAIEVRLHRTTLGVCDLGGNILEQREVETVIGDGDKFFSSCGRMLAEMTGKYKKPLVGVGVSICVILNHMDGFIYGNNSLKWANLNARQILERETGCKVYVDNDGKAGALGELWFGPEAQDLQSFVFVWVCEGIGVGMVMENKLYHGYYGLDGQFGPQLIKFDGDWEEIPKENFWEETASDLAAVNRYSKFSGVPRGDDIEKDMLRLIELARRQDPHAVRAIKETARYLGVGIANINNGLGPERVIVGGHVVKVWDLVFPEMLRQVEKQTVYKVVSLKELIVPSSLESPPFQGAQAMVIREVFGSYEIW